MMWSRLKIFSLSQELAVSLGRKLWELTWSTGKSTGLYLSRRFLKAFLNSNIEMLWDGCIKSEVSESPFNSPIVSLCLSYVPKKMSFTVSSFFALLVLFFIFSLLTVLSEVRRVKPHVCYQWRNWHVQIDGGIAKTTDKTAEIKWSLLIECSGLSSSLCHLWICEEG